MVERLEVEAEAPPAELDKQDALRGRVTRLDGRPLEQAAELLYWKHGVRIPAPSQLFGQEVPGQELPNRAQTDAEGNFEILGLAPDSRWVVVAAGAGSMSHPQAGRVGKEQGVELVLRPIHAARVRMVDQWGEAIAHMAGGGLVWSMGPSRERCEFLRNQALAEWFFGTRLQPIEPNERVLVVQERVAHEAGEVAVVQAGFGRLGYEPAQAEIRLGPIQHDLPIQEFIAHRTAEDRTEFVLSWQGLTEAMQFEEGVQLQFCLADTGRGAMWSWPIESLVGETVIADIPYGHYVYWIDLMVTQRIERKEEKGFRRELYVGAPQVPITVDMREFGSVTVELVEADGAAAGTVTHLSVAGGAIGQNAEDLYLSGGRGRVDLLAAGTYSLRPFNWDASRGQRPNWQVIVTPGQVTHLRAELPPPSTSD